VNRKILLIQSDVLGAMATQRALAGVEEVVWAKTFSQGAEWLDQCVRGGHSSICAVVCDLSLPDSNGLATFERLFAHSRFIPIFILCDIALQGAAMLAFEMGAQRYFLKECTEDRVLADSVERAIERSDHESTLFEEKDRAQVTLEAIADGVISTDEEGLVTYCNPVAAALTGWPRDDAKGQPFANIFKLISAKSRESVPDPMARSMRENVAVSLTPDCLLVRPDGNETAIEDSAAPIHDRAGKVIGAVIVFRDVSASRAAALKMSYLAQHDVLTDLPNRILFADRLRQAIELAKRHGQMLAMLFLDLDRFKNINDSLGHAVGDQLLQSIGHRLTDCVRSMDTVSRQGGDEFVILLSDINHVEAAVVAADKILRAIALPHVIDDHELHITASVGIVIYPQDGINDATLLKNADAAMYHAKENGRNNYQFFTPDMHVRAVERQQIESEMRQALKLGQFVLHYQPIVELEHCAVVGVEVLVRWEHPLRGLLHPGSFMAVAEQCGFVIPLGRWMIREACRQARAWRDAGLPSMRIAVNTCALELRAKGFVEAVRDCLEVSGLAPADLEIEITETVLLQESNATAEILVAIADMGVHLALDDFGTGYSSLSHLKRYPISTLKIDRSFIRELATDLSDASIVDAVIGLGSSLGLRVVAEGVETTRQATLLRSQGCGEAQGYYFGRPVEASGLADLLESEGSVACEQVGRNKHEVLISA
jgi:diguanylate cyclase (GGDEF)-like protein/PAS domain S-box-containing protein